MSGGGDLPRLVLREPEQELEEALLEVRFAILRHPVAAQAIFAALVAEGRRVSCTTEGQALKERLARSPLVRRMRESWELASMNVLEADPAGPVPGDLLELFVATALSERPLDPRGST